MRITTPWLRSAAFDTGLILAPAWAVTLIALALPGPFGSGRPIGTGAWLLLVVGLDVAHVYATLYRTYLDPRERAAHGALLALVPLCCWFAATTAHALSPAAFWTLVAYTAVFHFARQQYGLMMLYATGEDRGSRARHRLDTAMISAAMIYPLIYWHAHLPRVFVWFIDGDFVPLPAWVEPIARAVYAGIALAYATTHAWRSRRGVPLNVPRQAIVLGTALSWWVAIIGYNGDLAFSAINIVSHAVPYLALVWIYGENRERRLARARRWYTAAWAPVLALLLVGLAYVEEGLWDGLVWRERLGVFTGFASLPVLAGTWRDLVVPLLILPQLTHYVLDGYIWRLRADPTWADTLYWRRRTATP